MDRDRRCLTMGAFGQAQSTSQGTAGPRVTLGALHLPPCPNSSWLWAVGWQLPARRARAGSCPVLPGQAQLCEPRSRGSPTVPDRAALVTPDPMVSTAPSCSPHSQTPAPSSSVTARGGICTPGTPARIAQPRSLLGTASARGKGHGWKGWHPVGGASQFPGI